MLVRPLDSLLICNYELDEFSYTRMAKTKLYSSDRVLLAILPDNSFRITDLPDMIIDSSGKPIQGKMYHVKGNWNLMSDSNHLWNIGFKYLPDSLFKAAIYSYPLRYRGNKPAILISREDSGPGNGLLFVKQ
jgi:hypothetical protein